MTIVRFPYCRDITIITCHEKSRIKNIFYHPSLFILCAQVIMEKTINYQNILDGTECYQFYLSIFLIKFTEDGKGF